MLYNTHSRALIIMYSDKTDSYVDFIFFFFNYKNL